MVSCQGLVRGLAAALLLVGAGARLQGPDRTAPAPARALLERAGELRRSLRGTRGRERVRLRERAIEAYRDVAGRFPGERALAAEARFRAGELLRAASRPDAARLEFEQARDLGRGSALEARAGLELGHISRRAGLLEEALIDYQRALAADAAPPSPRDEALLWCGRSCAELGRTEEARAYLERAARTAADPCDRVAAHDELVLCWIAAGDLEAAAGELERCRAALGDAAREETPLGERVRSALLRMRSVERLRQAIARRREGLAIER